MIKNIVFGDTGGHASQLFGALESLGIDLDTYAMPKNLRVIHLGDLIHKGPDSSVLMEVVDQLITHNPGQWVQLIGNHESQHLVPLEGLPAPYFWNCNCGGRSITKLNYWWNTGKAVFAFGLDSFEPNTLQLEVSQRPQFQIPDTGILFVHGGLTHTWWSTVVKQNNSANQVSQIINALPLDVACAPGQLMGVPNKFVGPVWAIGNTEVYPEWFMAMKHTGNPMPFIQIHGHTQSYDFVRGRWYPVSKSFRDNTKLNPILRTVVTEVAGSLMVGVDPGFSTKANLDIQPFITFESNK